MSDEAIQPANFTRQGDQMIVRFQLTLDNHVDEVWAALTRSDQLARWLAPGEIEPRVGGAARMDFGDSGIVIQSTVSAFEPGRLLEYSWSGAREATRPLRWELEPMGAACVLTLTLTTPASEDPDRAAAGWAAHLEMLAATLAGVSIHFPYTLFKAAREAYSQQIWALQQVA